MTSTTANASGFPCKHCGSHDIRRSHRQSWLEAAKMALGVYPFRCLKCGARFSGNIWMLSSQRHAKCPRCLRLDVIAWVRKDYQKSAWQDILMLLGARQYRCVPCRLNFASFQPRCVFEDQAQPQAVKPEALANE